MKLCNVPLAGPENDTWQSKQTKEAKKMSKNVAIYSLVNPKIKSLSDKLHVARWQLAAGNWNRIRIRSRIELNRIELNWIVRRVACHPARPVSPHGVATATGLKQSHQSACTGDCCHIVHTRICVSTSLISGRARRSSSYYHYHLTTVTTLYDMIRHGLGLVRAMSGLEKCANASEHASFGCLAN